MNPLKNIQIKDVNPPSKSSVLGRLVLPSYTSKSQVVGIRDNKNSLLLGGGSVVAALPTRPVGRKSRIRGRTVAFGRPNRISKSHPLLPQQHRTSKQATYRVPIKTQQQQGPASSSSSSVSASLSRSVLTKDETNGVGGYIYCLVRNFYTLEQTTREQAIACEVFVRKSKDGVIRTYKDSRQPKEYTDIKRWNHETKCYTAMQKLDFFRQGLPRRAFQNWAIIVRRTKFKRAQKQLRENWFAIHPSLSEPLNKMWNLRLQFLSSTRQSIRAFETLRQVMLSVRPGKPSLNQLREHLLDSKASGLNAVDVFIKAAQDLVHNTFQMLLSMGLGKTNTSIGMERKISEAPVQKYDLPHRLIHEIRRFIRLVDVVATSTLIRGCILKQNVLQILLHKGKHHVDRQEVGRREFLIQIQVHTNMERRDNTSSHEDVELEPSLSMIHQLLIEIEQNYMKHVINIERLSGQIDLEKTLRQVRTTAKNKGFEQTKVPLSAIVMTRETLNIMETTEYDNLVHPMLIQKHPEWIYIGQKNRISLTEDFNAVLKSSVSIVEQLLCFTNRYQDDYPDDYQDKYQDECPNERILPSVTTLQNQIRDGECPLNDISTVVKVLQTHRKELQRINTIVHMGPLTTNLKYVQDGEMQRTKTELKQLSKMLPLLLERVCLTLRDEVLSLQSRIDDNIETLKGASATILITMTIASRMEALRDNEIDSKRLNQLLDILNLRPSEETAACLPTLSTLLDQLQGSLYGLLSRKEDTISHMRLHIYSRVGELTNENHDLRTELMREDSFICDPKSEPQDALAALESYESRAEQACQEGILIYEAEQIFSNASPEDSKNKFRRRQTLLEDTNNCCILLTSTRDMVSTMVQLHTLTLTLRKHVRNAAERAAVGETKADLSILHQTSKQLIKVAQKLEDSMNIQNSELCETRAEEATDSNSVVDTINRLRRAVQSDLSVDHRDEIIDILHPDKQKFRPAIANAAKLSGLGWIRIKDLYNISIEARASIDCIIHASESEAALREKFVQLKKEWSHRSLTFGNWQKGTMSILDVTEDFAQYLENTNVEVCKLITNPFSTNIRDELDDFADQTKIVQETTTDWLAMQFTFQQLLQVFDSASVKLELKKDFQILRRAGLDWEELFAIPFEQSALEFIADGKFQNNFAHISTSLETITNGVYKYLETRRLSFPRFYFLHDVELLSVLEHALKMHEHFDTHVHRIFPGIKTGTFDRSDRKKPILTQVHSTSNETLTLLKPVSGGIDFLPMVSRQIGVALRQIFSKAKILLKIGGGDISLRSKEAIALLVPVHMFSTLVQCEFFMTIERLLRSIDKTNERGSFIEQKPFKQSLESMSSKNMEMSTNLTINLRKLLTTGAYGLASDLMEMRVRLARAEAILLHDLCARDNIQSLIANNVHSIDHSEWSIRSKMSLTRGEGIMMNVGNIRIDYGFEYVGSNGMGAGHLVLSHTVMRCMWAIAHATQMLNCCALVHPTSQGQLNLIQGMAAVCAIYSPSVKFSIDAHHEYVLRIIKGASACSCWLRLSNIYALDTISSAVLGQSISSLVLAVQRGLTKMTLGGIEIPVLLRTTLIGVECTGHEFEDRFPKQLRHLFHTTGVIAADSIRVSELILMSRGVLDSANLVSNVLNAVSNLTNHVWKNDSKDRDRTFQTSTVLHIVNRAVAKVRASEEELDIEYVIGILIKSMLSSNFKNRYDNSLCTPGDRFMIRKTLNKSKLNHLLYAEKGVVELHCALNLWSMVALVGTHGIGKTSIRRALLLARDDIRAGTGKKRKRLRRGAARNQGSRASVSLPKGRRSSLVSPKRMDMRGTARFLFPETLSFDELYGVNTENGWVEGVIGHMIKTMNSEKIAQLDMQDPNTQDKSKALQYIVVDGCHRTPVIEVLLHMSKRNVLELPNGETIGIHRLNLQIIVEVTSLEWLSPGHIASMGIVPLSGDVDLPVIFFNLCQRLSEGALITTFQQKVISKLQNLCEEITEIDIIGCTGYSAQVMPCAMAASRMIEGIVRVAYAQGKDSFKECEIPSIEIISKCVLCYSLLSARSAFVENLPVEPTSGLLLGWLEEVAEDLPLVVRRMEPKKMLETSGYLLIKKEVDTIPSVLEASGSISFCHLSGTQGNAYLLSVMAKTGIHVALAGPSRVGKTAIAHATTSAIGNISGNGYQAWYAFVVEHNKFNPHSLGSAISECFSMTYGNVLAGKFNWIATKQYSNLYSLFSIYFFYLFFL